MQSGCCARARPCEKPATEHKQKEGYCSQPAEDSEASHVYSGAGSDDLIECELVPDREERRREHLERKKDPKLKKAKVATRLTYRG